MISSSDQTILTPKSFPSTFSSYRAFKRFQRAKTWRDASNRSSPIRSPLSSAARSSPPFIKYLHDYKKGKFNSADDFIISNSKEGEVINSISALLESDVPSSFIFNPFSNLPFHDNSDAMDISIKSGVIITSIPPRVLYSPRNPPIPRLPSVSTSFLFLTTIVFDEILIPACPSHYSKVFK